MVGGRLAYLRGRTLADKIATAGSIAELDGMETQLRHDGRWNQEIAGQIMARKMELGKHGRAQ